MSSVSSGESDTSSVGGPRRKKGFSQPVAICFTINYLIGTGFLTLPWAFQEGGILLSTITLAFVVIICNISKNYVLETMARAEAMIESIEDSDEVNSDSFERASLTSSEDLESSRYGSTDEMMMMKKQEPQEDLPIKEELSEPLVEKHHVPIPMDIATKGDQKYIVKKRKFEYVELCQLFLGDLGEKCYITAIALSICAQLWGYTSVFSSAMAEKAPIVNNPHDDYTIYTFIFALMVVPLSCLDLKEQVQFQILLSVCRMVVIVIMIVTSLVAGFDDDKVHFVGTDGPGGASLVDFSGFYEMFSVLVFAAMFHNAIPVLSEPVADKRFLGGIFRNAFIILVALYWSIAFSVAWFFGDHIEQSSNLNWDPYVGGTGHPSSDGSDWVNVAIWARAISYFVVLFPAINIISAYPLNAIVLGNNLMIKLHGQRSIETHGHLKKFYRVLSSAPPIVGALFVRELGIITSYAGILAIITVLSFPSLMYISSKKMAHRKGYLNASYYQSFGSSDAWAHFVLGISVAASVYILTKLIFDY